MPLRLSADCSSSLLNWGLWRLKGVDRTSAMALTPKPSESAVAAVPWAVRAGQAERTQPARPAEPSVLDSGFAAVSPRSLTLRMDHRLWEAERFETALYPRSGWVALRAVPHSRALIPVSEREADWS